MRIDLHGLRAAKKIIAEMRKEMSDDPSQRRNQQPFVRGKRAALIEMDCRISERIATLLEKASP